MLLIFRVRVLTGVIDFSPENIVWVEAGFKARLVDDPNQVPIMFQCGIAKMVNIPQLLQNAIEIRFFVHMHRFVWIQQW